MKDVSSAAGDLRSFITDGIWRIRTSDLSGLKGRLILALRVLIVSVRKFISDGCSLRASALTFYTLMSIVPVAALIFAVAKGFGFKKYLQESIMEHLSDRQEVVAYIIEFSEGLLESARGGVLAGAGIIVLLWAVVKMLGHVEESFNTIWGVTRQRSLGRKFSDYLSIMLIAPVLLVVSSSAAVMVVSHMGTISDDLGLAGFIAPLMDLAVRIVPFLLIWLLLSFMYVFIPNRKINLSSGVIAGACAGVIFIALQRIYIGFQIGVSHYNAIYGSFAALPLFLVFLQLGWFIVLFGAELSYAHQNVRGCGFDIRTGPYLSKLIGLSVAHAAVTNFTCGRPGPTASSLSERLGLPAVLVRTCLVELIAAGFILEVHPLTGDGEPSYVPAKDTGSITVASVVQSMEGTRALPSCMEGIEEVAALQKILSEFDRELEASEANRLLRDLSDREQA